MAVALLKVYGVLFLVGVLCVTFLDVSVRSTSLGIGATAAWLTLIFIISAFFKAGNPGDTGGPGPTY